MTERKYIQLSSVYDGNFDRIAYYDNHQSGPVLLMIHGFAEFGCTFEQLINFLPDHYRLIRVDLKGFGYSSKNDPEHMTIFDQAEVMLKFVEALNLKKFSLLGHSMGGAISCVMLENEMIRERIDKLILIDSAGMFNDVPDFIQKLSLLDTQNPLIRFTNEELMAYLIMEDAYCKKEKISHDLVSAYAEVMREPKAKECIISAAREFRIANVPGFQQRLTELRVPTVIIWGAEDKIIPLEDGELFNRYLSGSHLVIFPECGHSPQEECPEETGKVICEFLLANVVIEAPGLSADKSPDSNSLRQKSLEQWENYKLRMTRLVDRWSFGTIIVLIFIKILQILKKFGMRAEENGWRKATGIFLKNEYSKFILTCFRINYFRKHVPHDCNAAKKELIERLAAFIRSRSELHWSVLPHGSWWGRQKVTCTDIAEAVYDTSGELKQIKMHFDDTRENSQVLSDADVEALLRQIVIFINESKRTEIATTSLSQNLYQWIKKNNTYSYSVRVELRDLVDRVLNATFVHFEVLESDDPHNLKRLATPNLRRCRHPGYGLLNIIIRFAPDLKECDFWVQFHHVPVDGMPMQEIISELKSLWSCNGVLPYPPVAADTRPEITFAGGRLFRSRFFVDFSGFLALRKELNQKYSSLMDGPASVAGMVIWGMAQHRFFRDFKMLFPIDTEPRNNNPADRELSLVFIRPGKYIDRNNPLNGFISFQKEFNQRLWRTRMGESESYELLELYSMVHPFWYKVAQKVMPNAMGEFIGSMGLSILRDAEIFISPLSDLQINGFMTIGDVSHPTVDGKSAGAVCICGNREQIRFYHQAILHLANNYRNFIEKDTL